MGSLNKEEKKFISAHFIRTNSKTNNCVLFSERRQG